MAKSSTNSSPYATQLEGCTIRARVAFVLAVAEWARDKVITSKDASARLHNAFDLAWRWQQTANVSGKTLDSVLADEADTGLAVEESMAPTAEKPAWVTITSAICYVCWHAYINVGDEEGMSEFISEVREDVIDQTIDFARRVPGFNQAAVDRLAQYCINHHKMANDKELGEPISRETMMQVADWARA